MFDDRRMRAATAAMLAQVSVPPLPSQALRRRVSEAHAPAVYRSRPNLLAVAAAVGLAILLVPAVAPGFTQSLRNEIRELLHWTPPPPAPKRVWQAMRPQTVTLEQARARASFTLVPPAGLPHDATGETIATISPGVFSKSRASWSVGASSITFTYRRRNGRQFTIWASGYDPREAPPSKYIFEDMDTMQNGHEVIIRRDRYTWRNGSQVTSAIVGEGLREAEVVAIRAAMHGTPVVEVWPSQPSGDDKQYRLP